MTTFLLVHGGLWEDGMDAGRFWHETGIAAGLLRRSFEVLTPTRLRRASSWAEEPAHLAADFPGTVSRLLLAWPATSSP